MELTSDNLFLFILKKYRHNQIKLKKKSSPEKDNQSNIKISPKNTASAFLFNFKYELNNLAYDLSYLGSSEKIFLSI